MTGRLLFIVTCAATLSACSTTSDFSRALEEPVKVTNAAAAVVTDSSTDIMEISAFGLRTDAVVDPGEIACIPTPGPASAGDDLSVFGDSLDAVQKVGAAPKDTSYAGYIRQFRQNRDAMKPPASLDARNKERDDKLTEAQTRCTTLFAADISARTALAHKTVVKGAVLPFIGIVMAWNEVIKDGLAAAEQAQREAAVRETVKRAIPDMKLARDHLFGPIAPEAAPAFGPIVQYPDGASALVSDPNKTVLGAVINVRRWYVAQIVKSDWDRLQSCRTAQDFACLGDPAARAVASDFSANGLAYRKLAGIDVAKIKVALDSAITGAEQSVDKGSFSNLLDALATIGDSVSTISDAVGKAKK